MSNYKLMSYNTSWVLDCSSNQFNGALSESAAIMAKMKYMKNYESYEDMYKNPNYRNELDEFRFSLANKATNYIKTVGINGAFDGINGAFDFIALIEQSMHVPKSDHANYDDVITNKFYIGENTENFGFSKRLKDLGLSGSSTFTVVYDNVINWAFKAAEGIAIVYKTSLVSSAFKWNFAENPALRNDKKLAKNFENVNFYSDDLGPYICYDDPKSANKNLIYSKVNGVADEGRPIILTGGILSENDKNTLNLFVAAHGANILNLFVYDPSEEKLQTKSVKKLEPDTLTNLFQKLGSAITSFIQNGLDATAKVKIIPDIEKVNLFLGGDFNDAWGFILTGLMANGITLKINEKPFTVKFNYPKLKQRGTFGNGAGYDLLSCCANADSIKTPNTAVKNLLGPIVGNSEEDYITMAERMESYGDDFIKHENFGCNGDYALFGSTNDTTTYDLRVDNHPLQQIEKTKGDYVIASDHLPVISMPTTVATNTKGGKHKRTKRRRNRRTARKLRNKRHYYSRRRY